MVDPPEPGIRRCQACGWKFVSPDPERIRRCQDCKQHEETYEPITAKIEAVEHAVRSYQRNI